MQVNLPARLLPVSWVFQFSTYQVGQPAGPEFHDLLPLFGSTTPNT